MQKIPSARLESKAVAERRSKTLRSARVIAHAARDHTVEATVSDTYLCTGTGGNGTSFVIEYSILYNMPNIVYCSIIATVQ